MNIRKSLNAAGYFAMWRAVSLMSQDRAYRAMERVFDRQYRKDGPQVKRLRKTFAPIVPNDQLEATVEAAFRWYARYWAEAFHLPKLRSELLTQRFSVDGLEHIQGALERGKGAVLATLHQGNWDTGGRWVAERFPLTAVAERLDPKAMTDRFIEYRRQLGMNIITLEPGADVTSKCAEIIRRNELVALLADRDLSGRGVEVKFFGQRAKMARGPAVLAARTGCEILPAVIYQRNDGTHHAVVEPALPPTRDETPDSVSSTTQLVAEAYERFIAAEPAQWHMFQRFWPGEAQ